MIYTMRELRETKCYCPHCASEGWHDITPECKFYGVDVSEIMHGFDDQYYV